MSDRGKKVSGFMGTYQDLEKNASSRTITMVSEEGNSKSRLKLKIPVRNSEMEKDYHLPSISVEDSNTCSICGATFVSIEFLHNHLRCHHESKWIQPPLPTVTTKSSLSSSSGSDDQSKSYMTSDNLYLDPIGHVPKKPRTGKRSQKFEEDVDDDMLAAAEGLILLSKGKGRSPEREAEGAQWIVASKRSESRTGEQVSEGSDLQKNRTKEESEAYTYPQSKKLKVDEQRTNSRHGFDTDLVNMSSAMVCFTGSSGEVYTVSKGVEPAGSSNFIGSDVVRNLMHLSSEAPLVEVAGKSDYKSFNGFKCSTCNKSFSTYQALGGHKSSQRNCKNTSNSDQSRDNGFHVNDSQEYTSTATAKPKGSGIHQCKTCGMTFSTGQALGGHQRKHWNGSTTVIEAVPLNSIAPQEKSANMEASSHSLAEAQAQARATSVEVRKPLDFDLNEMPVDFDDESSAGSVQHV